MISTDSILNAPRLLHVDNNEPRLMQKLIGQVSGVTYDLGPFNVQKHSDYWWLRADGKEKEVERKQWSEILSGGVEKIEEQLHRHLTDRPNAEHIFLLEGPVTQLGEYLTVYSNKGTAFTPGRTYRQNLSGIYAWLYQVSHFYTIVPTYNIQGSATALTAMYKSDGKLDHNTLNRNYNVRTHHRDPVIEKYMGLLNGIGEAKAEALRAKFPTVAHLVNAKRNDLITLPGFGPAIADNIQRQLGTFTQPKVRNG